MSSSNAPPEPVVPAPTRSGLRGATLLTALTLALPLTACGGEGGSPGSTLTVFAAASLTTAFQDLEAAFEDAHPGVDVKLAHDGSSNLVAQIIEGNDADVFAAADLATMATLVDAGRAAASPVEFATNTLMIAVPPGNPARIRGIDDLARAGLNLVLCQTEVPCGAAAHQIAGRAGIELHPVSEVANVLDVLGAVEAGEADAGLVYVTDVTAAGGQVEGIALDGVDTVVNRYPIVVVEGAEEPELAREWIDFVLGEGQSVLRTAGFGPPTP